MNVLETTIWVTVACACCAAVGGAVGGTHSGFITKTKKYFSVLSQKTKE